MDIRLFINGVRNRELAVRSVRSSYVRAWEAELFHAARHDGRAAAGLWDDVRIQDGSGRVLLRGNVTEVRPGGVSEEGVTYVASGRRFRLENEPVRINGRGFYIWNRRGHTCKEGRGGEDSPGKDGGKWTAGEIIIDILEHALGLPVAHAGTTTDGGAVSDILGHHGHAGCVTDPYLTAADVADYDPTTILSLDSVIGEFSVDNTSVADAISLLLALNGGFWGWYMDPASGELVVVDLDALPAQGLQAGELGHWQDEEGTDYVLLGNELDWSLDGVCSTIVIQGTDRTVEEQPANIEGTGNPGKGDLGELELVAEPWRDFAAAYRALAQPKRPVTAKLIDEECDYTPPAGSHSLSHMPRIYVGTDAGPKTFYNASAVYWLLASRMIAFTRAPSLGPGQRLWGWYWAKVPFTVRSGPAGDAYSCYGYERTRTVYDPAFRHPTSWPQPGTADDQTAMELLAERLLRLYMDVRRQGVLRCDGLDFDTFGLLHRYNVLNLGPTATGTSPGGSTTPAPGPTTTTPAAPDPMQWESLRVNAVEVLHNFDQARTDVTVANTFWMLEEYSELKRRLELNLFAQRELALSEDLYACQIKDTAVEHTTEGPTTPAPTTTTEGPCVEIGSTVETEAALTDTWSAGDGCVVVTQLVRMAYDHSGDQKLYAYYRDFTYEAAGGLVAVSAETRVTIDTPEPC